MTSAKFSGFLTPLPPSPCQHFEPTYSTKITQPPLLRQNLVNPPPSPSLLTSFVNGPKAESDVGDVVRARGVGNVRDSEGGRLKKVWTEEEGA